MIKFEIWLANEPSWIYEDISRSLYIQKGCVLDIYYLTAKQLFVGGIKHHVGSSTLNM